MSMNIAAGNMVTKNATNSHPCMSDIILSDQPNAAPAESAITVHTLHSPPCTRARAANTNNIYQRRLNTLIWISADATDANIASYRSESRQCSQEGAPVAEALVSGLSVP